MHFISYAHEHVLWVLRRSLVTAKAQKVCDFVSSVCTKVASGAWRTILSTRSDQTKKKKKTQINKVKRFPLSPHHLARQFYMQTLLLIPLAQPHYHNGLGSSPKRANSCEPVTACERVSNFTQFLRVRLCFCVPRAVPFRCYANFSPNTT